MTGSTFSCVLLSLFVTIVVTSGLLPPQLNYERPPLPAPSVPHPFRNVGGTKEMFLPNAVSPTHYTLKIRPILNDPVEPQFTAPGNVQILLHCHVPTNQVTVHKDPTLVVHEDTIQMYHVNADGSQGSPVEVVSTSFNESTVFYTFNLGAELEADQRYELSMDFTSQINELNAGLYRAEYVTPSGETRHMATTQFQSYGARMAFPCFDEPGIKATFDITIGRKTDQNSLCNTLPKSVGVEDPALPEGWVWDVYNQTQPMSSYLVAIIVSDFVCETADSSIFVGRPVRVCGPPHQIQDKRLGVVPAEAAAKTMKFLEDTFKYPYEMYKVDNAAIPRNYFAPGAMENWGLVTYRDNYVLFWDGESTEADRQGVFSIEFHELGHQWFGDLLTCATWGHVWLNEGFATYIAGLIEGAAPEFKTVDEFLWEKVQAALAYDVGRDEPVYNEEFDSGGNIIYGKGGSLLRMVRGVFGTDVFFQAMAEYVRENAYKPVMQDQFFLVLNEYAHAYSKIPEDITMKEIMDTWTIQAGYPVLKVSRIDDASISITQQEFLPTNTTVRPRAEKFWEVPVAIATSENPDFTNHTPALWLNRDGAGKTFEHNTDGWIAVNPDAMGFYRVSYDDELLGKIHEALAANLNTFSGLSRSQLIDDYFDFAELGHEPIEKALNLTQYLENEDNHVVWYTVFSHSSKAREMLGNGREMSAYLLPKLEAVLDRILVGWTIPLGDVGVGTKVVLTSKLLDWASALGSQNGRALALDLFTQWLSAPNNLAAIIPPDFQAAMLCHGVSQSGQAGYDFLLDEYGNSDPFGLVRGRFLNALSCVEEEFLERFVLENVLQLNGGCLSNCVTKSDASGFLQKVGSQSEMRPFLTKILKENDQKVTDYLGEKAVAEMLTSFSKYYNTEQELEEFSALVECMKSILSPPQNSILDEAVTRVKDNIKWMTQFGHSMVRWFAANSH